MVLVMEEFQVYFETASQEVNKQVADKLSKILAIGPSAGVILVSSSQKPSGVGAGDVQRLFNRFRDNHTIRFALKCGNRDVSMAVLGGDAYQEGFDASSLPVGDKFRGVGYLYGASDYTPTVRGVPCRRQGRGQDPRRRPQAPRTARHPVRRGGGGGAGARDAATCWPTS